MQDDVERLSEPQLASLEGKAGLCGDLSSWVMWCGRGWPESGAWKRLYPDVIHGIVWPITVAGEPDEEAAILIRGDNGHLVQAVVWYATRFLPKLLSTIRSLQQEIADQKALQESLVGLDEAQGEIARLNAILVKAAGLVGSVLDDSESRPGGWGPDVTCVETLRAAHTLLSGSA